MNGAQDLGGQMGFGPIEIEVDEPNFHAPWEERAFALTLAMGATGTWSIDTSRYMRETLHPVDYLSSSYYEIWLKGLERLVVAYGLASRAEIGAGRMLEPAKPVKNILTAGKVAATLAKGGPPTGPQQRLPLSNKATRWWPGA
ncbi:nitrile hydratase [Roseibium hamelinense]|uniref:Nitrile hydratase n=1 Tax=Roseibium hamelinense TaxID=150831 RepID=A0A562T805_9HYPH|nr:nitrile hydratase subunit beta [Roseibium hamelinense]TWI89433.1 nitrile hydratase [Roseibium hamelinense]